MTPHSEPRELVLASWERARVHDLDPDHLLSPLWADGGDLRGYREGHPLAEVMPVIRKLLVRDADGDSGMLVAVGDAMGRLLWVEGDQRLKSRAESMMFVEGADWNESVAGTSAPGTALTLDRSVQIHRSEHFNRLVHDWSCTAVPVHDPDTKAILGVIDITGGDQAVDRHTLPLVEATVAAVENELLIRRLSARRTPSSGIQVAPKFEAKPAARVAPVLSVLGRDDALLTTATAGTKLSRRHSEILMLLCAHPQGLSAEALSELLYGADNTVTLRAEITRLRKLLETAAPDLTLESRPYRLIRTLETDAGQVRALVQRGAHRAAVSAYRGDVLPGSMAPGIVELRDELRATIRERVLADSSIEVLMGYLDSDLGRDDADGWRLALGLLPPRSPRRAAAVARLEALETASSALI
ncbi:MAG: GAF domain-containing protein [Agromyces sp.]